MPLMHSLILANIITDWWTTLGFAQHVFYGIAIFAACIIVVMTLISMLGLHADIDVDIDDVDSGTSLLSIKPLTGFLFAFGWAGGAAISNGFSIFIASCIALAAGLAVMFGLAALLKATQRLKADGTMKKENAIGKIATVYITIPPAGQSGGQVIVPLDGRTVTFAAFQDGTTAIPSDAKVKVLALIDSQTVRIELA